MHQARGPAGNKTGRVPSLLPIQEKQTIHKSVRRMISCSDKTVKEIREGNKREVLPSYIGKACLGSWVSSRDLPGKKEQDTSRSEGRVSLVERAVKAKAWAWHVHQP